MRHSRNAVVIPGGASGIGLELAPRLASAASLDAQPAGQRCHGYGGEWAVR